MDFLIGLVIFLISTSIYGISLIGGQYYFQYSKDKLIVKNRLKKSFKEVFEADDIVLIKKVNTAYVGFGIAVIFRNGNKKVYHTNASRNEIEELIEDLSKKNL